MTSASPEFKLGTTTEHTRDIDIAASNEWLCAGIRSLHPDVDDGVLRKIMNTVPEDELLRFGQLYMGIVAAIHKAMISNNE